MQDVAATDRVTGNHRDDGLRGASNLHLEIEDVEASNPLLCNSVIADVAIVSANDLVAAGAERPVPLTSKDDHTHRVVIASDVESVRQFEEGLRPERVALMRPVDGDLGDSNVVTGGDFVADIGVVAALFPLRAWLN